MELAEAIRQCENLIVILPNFHLGGSEAIETVLYELEKVTKERDSIYQDYQDLGKEFYNNISKKEGINK